MRSTVLLLALAACTAGPTTDDVDDTDVDAVLADDLPNPIVPDVPLLPWPSDQYLIPDATSATGRRVSVPEALLPSGLTRAMFARDDGFSRVVPIVTWMAGGFDPSTLPDATDWAATTRADATVQLVEVATGTRWPAMVEVDATARGPEDQTLLVRPHRALTPETTFAVIVTDGVHAADGSVHTASDAFVTLRDGLDDDDRALSSWRPAFATLSTLFDELGIEPAHVLQAWTFTTRSEGGVIDPGIALQDAVMDASTADYTLTGPLTDTSCGDACVVYEGTLTVPSFLDADHRFVFGDDGLPTPQGTLDAPFLVTIPKVITDTRPVVLFGHGFFSGIEEPTWGNLFGGLETWQMAAVTTKFYGFAEEDLIDSAAVLGGRLYDLDTIVDQQLQSHANFTMVHRLITERLAAALEVDLGQGPLHPLDGTQVPYMGISNGGTQGLVMMTTSPVLDRGGLVVAGGGWSHMLQRASQWNELGALFSAKFPDHRNLQLAMSLLQQVFDPVDSLNYVDHLIDDRLPGRPAAPDLLLVEAVNDAQVANLVTDWVAGEAGFPLVTPSPRTPWGLDSVTATEADDVRVGMEIYDLGVPDNPSGNVAPEENDVHDHVRLLDSYRTQMGTFLDSGRVVHPCDGACDPE
ncbi:MAG: hypothetical protein H6733_05985 [Alphaproteobacteria bacterium]|nr:hypothetical protein [Alphaproteobacteria bacterium]